MKKLIAISIVTFVLLAASVISYADLVGTSKTVTVDLAVDSLFGFTLWDTQFTQDLGIVQAGVGALGNLNMAASSNHPTEWRIQASSSGLSGPGAVIPVVISTVGAGTTVTDLTLSAIAADIYTAALAEYPAVGVAVDGIFSVTAATDQEQGSYSGTIVLTMVE